MKVILIVFALALSIGCQADSQPVKVQDAGVKDAQPQKKDAALPRVDATGTDYTDDPDFVGC
tara:strand:- start:688 stop:873 length:186 start_codon:yes stop_codon:yes gene_type:complete